MSQAATELQITACATTAHRRDSDASGCRIGVINQFPASAATKNRRPMVQSSICAFESDIDTPVCRANEIEFCCAAQLTASIYAAADCVRARSLTSGRAAAAATHSYAAAQHHSACNSATVIPSDDSSSRSSPSIGSDSSELTPATPMISSEL